LKIVFFLRCYRNPLADAVKAGWAQSSELKEPDFDAVRGRDDFRKLVAEVGAKAGPKAK
jgi:hypothetical protein